MEIIQVASKPQKDSRPQILLIGKFDGIHIGHSKLIQIAKNYLKNDDLLSVMSFSDHPLWILKKDLGFKHSLTPENDKKTILENLGIQRFYQIEFTKEYAKTSAKEFVLDHLSKLHIKRIVVGEGFHFGKGGQSDTNDLMELCKQVGIPVTVVPHIKENGKKISSTTIRTQIIEGKMEAAQSLLGRPYSLTGHVIHGEALGRKLGFPTLNITGSDDNYVLPKPGIYLGFADIGNGEHWNALISAGFRPTVDGDSYLIEAHLINFSGDLYGEKVSLSFLNYMREEIKFSNLDSLIDQMNIDMYNAKVYFGMSDE